jgi:hypothetical protein
VTRTGFKVVRRINDRLYSVWGGCRTWGCRTLAIGLSLGFVRRYVPRRWTSPKGGNGALALFSTLGAAQEFVVGFVGYGHIEIWRCEYQPSRRRSLWFWDDPPLRGNQVRSIHEPWMLPTGTVLADSVRLVEQVQVPS